MFKPIDKVSRKVLEQETFIKIIDVFRKEELEPGCYVYEVLLQNIRFKTVMTVDELKKAISYAVDIVEEFKSINNSGINRTRFLEIQYEEQNKIEQAEREDGEFWLPFNVINIVQTDELKKIKAKIAALQKVGGAYWVLISNPGLVLAMYAVFERIVDEFDNIELYAHAVFFIVKAIMRVRSEELVDKEDMCETQNQSN